MPSESIEQPLLDVLFTAPGYGVVAAFVFVFGLLIGSFLNVAIYRLPLGMSLNRPRRSFCYRCGTPIRWYDNIPVVSLILLRGRDRACGAPISPRYAFVELLTGLLFLGLWVAHNPPLPDGGFSPSSLWLLVFIAFLIIGTFTDLDHWIIPPSIPRIGTVAALVVALFAGFFDHGALIARSGPFPALRLVEGDWLDTFVAILMGPSWAEWRMAEIVWWEPLANAAIGAIGAPLGIWLIGWAGKHLFRKDAMGLGDVELFAMIGATVGLMNSVFVLVVASFVGSIVGGIQMLRNRLRTDDSPLALGVLPEGEPESATESVAPEDPEEVAHARGFAEGLEMEFVDLDAQTIPAEAVAALPADVALRHGVVPLAVTETSARLAVEDPLRASLVQELRAVLGRDLDFVIAPPSQIQRHCRRLFASTNEESATPPLWKRYYAVASLLPVPRPTHHLPFIPWIATGAVAVVILQQPLVRFLMFLFYPAF
jgi:leader peptidase (prepilin peptidase)/N-methyltransferase